MIFFQFISLSIIKIIKHSTRSEKISSHKNYDPILKLNNYFLLTGRRRRRDKSASQEIKKKGFIIEEVG